jgi:hypothetical protein
LNVCVLIDVLVLAVQRPFASVAIKCHSMKDIIALIKSLLTEELCVDFVVNLAVEVRN